MDLLKKYKKQKLLKKDDTSSSSSLSSSSSSSSSSSLPIYNVKDEILLSIEKYSTTILVGETGSGKSTQLPQYLMKNKKTNSKCIICTQPRRVAAITLAQRVAYEQKVDIGKEVGYSVRFEDKCSNDTQVKYVTDGVLLREFMSDHNLLTYNTIILDEAHERSLQTDILMGLLRQLQEKRPELRLVIMSATLQVDLFMNYFKNPNFVKIPGRQHPVDVYYVKEPEPDYIDAALLTCLQIHEEEEPGGVLVFLPGQEDIEGLQSLLEEHLPSIKGKINNDINENDDHDENNNKKRRLQMDKASLKDFEIFPLYAALSADDQLKAFATTNPWIRKFVLSTNIAETSVTISGIKYVVDLGFVKTRLINPSSGLDMLKILPVSQSQANQRAGRAGRETAGKCFRLFDEKTFESLDISSLPEIQRVGIGQVVLQLKVLGVNSIPDFPFLSPPSPIALKDAIDLLRSLGALNKRHELTENGRKMASLPLDPSFAYLLLKSQEFKCVNEMLTAVAVLSSDSLFLQPDKEAAKNAAGQAHKRFAAKEGDLLTVINIYDSWIKSNQDMNWTNRNYLSFRALKHALSVRKQLSELLTKLGIDITLTCKPEKEPFLRCLAAGLFLNVAKKTADYSIDRSVNLKHKYKDIKSSGAPYKTIRGGQPVHIHPSSTLFHNSSGGGKTLPDCVVYAELLITSKQYLRTVTAVDSTWLPVKNSLNLGN